jgi:hypothetical protein
VVSRVQRLLRGRRIFSRSGSQGERNSESVRHPNDDVADSSRREGMLFRLSKIRGF